MARDTIGPFKTEAEAAEAAYRFTRASGEPHTITALGPDKFAAQSWLVARGRIRECWLEKKAVTPPCIAWPVTFVSPADKAAEPEAQTKAAPVTDAALTPEEEAGQGTGPWPIPADEIPRAKGKKA